MSSVSYVLLRDLYKIVSAKLPDVESLVNCVVTLEETNDIIIVSHKQGEIFEYDDGVMYHPELSEIEVGDHIDPLLWEFVKS